jgi:hypothetical protein
MSLMRSRSATVRRCTARESKFPIGLEFTGLLTAKRNIPVFDWAELLN